MAGNNSLHEAKVQKNDEFYTRLVDIENELGHYTEHFKDKVVLCNCDDPQYSNFCKYFALNFNYLGLKKLLTTHYEKGKQSYKLEYVRVDDPSGQLSLPEAVQTPLQGDSDFRSEECIEILKEADIVVGNPPFSLWRPYIGQLMEYNKSFLILGNMNAITYKEVFPLIKDNKIWLGYNNGAHDFMVPDDYTDKKFYIGKDGKKYVKMGNVCWYTNLDIKKRHEPLFLTKKYDPALYPKYDNYDAINVNKVKDIPRDWDGVMGIPITFLDKYNPEQFEIIGFGSGSFGVEIGVRGYKDEYLDKIGSTIPIRGNLYYVADGAPVTPYKRILIRAKKEGDV